MSDALLASNPRAMRCLREAAELRLIGLLLELPRADWKESVAALALEIGDPDLRAAAEAAREEADEGLYHTILGPGGPAPPREVSHRGAILPGGLLAEISAYYDAFAYSPTCGEAPDHVAVQTGFLAYLRLKEAYACFRGEEKEAELASDASLRFVEGHVSRVAAPFARCVEATGVSYLTIAAAQLVKRVGPAPDAALSFPWRHAGEGCPDEGCEFECGTEGFRHEEGEGA